MERERKPWGPLDEQSTTRFLAWENPDTTLAELIRNYRHTAEQWKAAALDRLEDMVTDGLLSMDSTAEEAKRVVKGNRRAGMK